MHGDFVGNFIRGVVFVSILVLVAILLYAFHRSRDALVWCAKQSQAADALRTAVASADSAGDPASGEPAPSPERLLRSLVPLDADGPLAERASLLDTFRKTALAEGQLMTLLFRRDDVEGEHVAADMSHLLVVSALAFTILGLIGTLGWLGISVDEAGQTGPGAVMVSVGAPLRHLWCLFLPTAIGLVFAAVATSWQGRIDREIERTWTKLDRVTRNLLEDAFEDTGYARQAEALDQLREASTQFARAARQVNETMGRIESSVKVIEGFNEQKWVDRLIEAADAFDANVRTSSDNLKTAAGEISEALADLPASTGELKSAAKSVAAATDRISQATIETAATLDTVRGTLEPLSRMPEAVSALDGTVQEVGGQLGKLAPSVEDMRNVITEWVTQQHQLLTSVRNEISVLDDTIRPMVDQAQQLFDEAKEGRERNLAALGGVREQLENTSDALRSVIDSHQQALLGLPDNIEKSVRLGYEAWLVAVDERFDHDEQLFNELRALREQLDRSREAFDAAAGLAREVQGPGREMLDRSVTALDGLASSVAALERSMMAGEQWVSPDAWRNVMDEHSRRIERALQPLSAIHRLESIVARLSDIIERSVPSRTAADRAAGGESSGDWLRRFWTWFTTPCGAEPGAPDAGRREELRRQYMEMQRRREVGHGHDAAGPQAPTREVQPVHRPERRDDLDDRPPGVPPDGVRG